MIIQCVEKKMAEKLDNQFIPQYIPSDIKWYERDGLIIGIQKINVEIF